MKEETLKIKLKLEKEDLIKNKNNEEYWYGMKRPFGIGNQPSGQLGLLDEKEVIKINKIIKPNIDFNDIVKYPNELTKKEIYDYELIDLSIFL